TGRDPAAIPMGDWLISRSHSERVHRMPQGPAVQQIPGTPQRQGPHPRAQRVHDPVGRGLALQTVQQRQDTVPSQWTAWRFAHARPGYHPYDEANGRSERPGEALDGPWEAEDVLTEATG
ncbi:hypothetical protein ACWDRX_29020, partial [Streptomyces nigra]